MRSTKILLLVALFTLCLNALAGIQGAFIRKEKADFEVNQELMQDMLENGTSYYSVILMTKAELLKEENANFLAMDYMELNKLENHSFLVSKHVYVMDREADFFSCDLFKNIKYVRAGEKESVTRTGEMNYLLKGEQFMIYKYQFDLNFFVDFPDCQNIDQGVAAMGEALSKVKYMDPAMSTYPLYGVYLKDKPNFTKFLTAGWVFSKVQRVPHEDGEKTLMINYEISGMPSQYAIKNIVENGHVKVMELAEKTNSNFKNDGKH